ncbi:unnamed protein product [Miscanthus lutarioriparius]|uniref:Retrotransposon gag domain-containing protein n=1 Tax=Miscanthus lutarioriparius TaxID=422564 RepID=A0A811RJ83_9POAL|nr:unnamed protein product [Miscanthus lutarioriparius]
MRWHMRGLRLWEFLSGELPCPALPDRPVQPVIPPENSEEEQKKLREAYDDDMASYMSHFRAYRTWLDEDARAGAVLVASMEKHLAGEVIRLDHAAQMWAILRQRYEPSGQSTYIAALRQEQLLQQGDNSVEDFFRQLSAIWRELDTLSPQLSPDTCDSCRKQQSHLELRRTYDFLTRLRDEFEPLRAQLLAHEPCVSLMEALAAIRNEETRLRSAGLLPPQSWLLGLEFLVLLPQCLLQQPLVARGLATQVAFIVSTVAEMDMMRIIVTRRRGRLSLSLAEVGVPHMLSLSILMHSRR